MTPRDVKPQSDTWSLKQDSTMMTYSTTLHRNPSFLFIFSGIKVPNLACQSRRDDIVRRQERIHKRRLSVIYVCKYSDILNRTIRWNTSSAWILVSLKMFHYSLGYFQWGLQKFLRMTSCKNLLDDSVCTDYYKVNGDESKGLMSSRDY